MKTNDYMTFLRSYPEALASQERFRAYLGDCFPEDKGFIRLLTDTFAMGIVNELKNNELDNMLVNRIVMRLKDDYFYDDTRAREVTMMWIDAYGVGVLGKRSTVSPAVNSPLPVQVPAVKTPRPFSPSNQASGRIQWMNGNQIRITPPLKTKKLTGTRFITLFGVNPYSTPFEVWCAVTRTMELPFTENMFTKAGKDIEPKQYQYMKRLHSSGSTTLESPSDRWGSDYFRQTYGDFFASTPVFGGMWDYLQKKNDRVSGVYEMKTTSEKNRAVWEKGMPDMYTLQAALYAYLLGVDNVYMVATFLQGADYYNTASFVCKNTNTIVEQFSLARKFPYFRQNYIATAEQWWKDHVLSGISPVFDPDNDRDAKLLAELQKL